MTISTLDAVSALIVIDLQKALVSRPTVHPAATVIERTNVLSAAFRRCGLPVVLVTVSGAPSGRTETPSNAAQMPPDGADLAEALQREPTDHRVSKRNWGPFTDTDLEAYLKQRGVTQVVITGVATSIGVESTARHARELGFNVTIAVDAVTDLSAEAHENSVRRIFPRLGETGTAQEIADRLSTGIGGAPKPGGAAGPG